MGRTHGFESLEVYRLADEAWRAVRKWSLFDRDTVGKQIVRAADSVGANIAEGEGRGSYADNRRFIRVARGSLNEVRHFLRRAYRRKLLDDETVSRLKPMIAELGPRLNAYLRSIGEPVDVPQNSQDTGVQPQVTNDKGQVTNPCP